MFLADMHTPILASEEFMAAESDISMRRLDPKTKHWKEAVRRSSVAIHTSKATNNEKCHIRRLEAPDHHHTVDVAVAHHIIEEEAVST